MRSRRRLAGLLFVAGVVLGVRSLAACGDRTGLLSEDVAPLPDASPDVIRDARHEDRFIVEEDATEDDGPPLIDSRPLPDVVINECPDAGSTLIYVVTEKNELFSFYPPDGNFKKVGDLSCPAPPGLNPFSMAVDRKGKAYVLFSDPQRTVGNIFRVSTLTAACVATSFVSGQSGFNTFGMGFAGDSNGTTETLFVAADNQNPAIPGRLGSIDTVTFTLTDIGPFGPIPVQNAELTGTGDGRLFAFYATQGGGSSAVAQIDRTNAQVIAANDMNGTPQGNGWAFAFWGGDFYLFTAPSALGHSQVTRFRPSDNSTTVVANLPTVIVGAGVSTCAPQQ